MGFDITLPEDLTEDDWRCAIADIGEEEGYYSELGELHAALFIERGQNVLFVAFETIATARAHSERGLPLAFDVCESRGWSHLTLLARRDTWFRDPEIYDFFDRMVDDAFFEEFDHVVFYGAGPCGYAACCYSVAAPGSTVIAVSPQATLMRPLTAWDSRFPSTRRTDFTSRYGFAPDMLDAAHQAFVIHDPEEIEDAMHAAFFFGSNIHHYRYRRGDAAAIDADMRAMGLVSRLADLAADDRLSLPRFAREFRTRKKHVPYLRKLLDRTLDEDRPMLTALLCRAVLREKELPRFRQHLDRAMVRLSADGRSLPHGTSREVV